MGKVSEVHRGVWRQQAGFLLILVLPTLLPLSWIIGQVSGWIYATALLPFVALFIILPLLDAWIGPYSEHPAEPVSNTWLLQGLPVVVILLHLAGAIWIIGGVAAMQEQRWTVGLIWALAIGEMSGVVTINVSHELIHRKNVWMRRLGGLFLATVCYASFKIEHVRWHHIWVATDKDPSTAKRGQTIYAFLPQAVLGNLRHAWQIQGQRNERYQGPERWLRNEMLWYSLTSVALALICLWLWSGPGLMMFLLQSLIAIVLLETINYIEHYGLRRTQQPGGRWQAVNVRHSWNSDYWLSNMMLLNLQRHSDHHAMAGRPFPELRSPPEAPQLPVGYATLFHAVYLPPLWFRIMHHRLDDLAST